MAVSVGEDDAYVVLRITKGVAVEFDAEFTNPPATPGGPETPVDITGWSFDVWIARDELTTVRSGTFAYEILSTNKARFTLAKAIVDALPCGLKPTDPASQYVWKFRPTDSLGRPLPGAAGPALVRA